MNGISEERKRDIKSFYSFVNEAHLISPEGVPERMFSQVDQSRGEKNTSGKEDKEEKSEFSKRLHALQTKRLKEYHVCLINRL